MTQSTQQSPDRPRLDETTVDADPFAQLRLWLNEATAAGIAEATAMGVATASRAGRPSARMVVMRGMDARGLVFYTDTESPKGKDLAENPFAALLFYWQPMRRQVRVEGTVEIVSPEESDRYFASRPLGHRIATAASRQSTVVRGRDELEQHFEELTAAHPHDIPRPAHWGGYRVLPELFEFWQSGANRLHDRVRYRRDGGAWIIERLSP